MDEIKKDPRFSHIVKDPRFRQMKRKDRKVTIDKRFTDMFHDSRFKLKYSVDKRGRPLHVTTTEDLKRYYDVSENESGEEEENQLKKGIKEMPCIDKKDKEDFTEEESEDDNEEESLSESDSCKIDVTTGPDYARGEAEMSSSDDDDDEEEIEGIEQEDVTGLPWGEIDHDAPEADAITHRLAVCNMDWDRIKAQDLMVLFNSFTPPGGVIKSVAIYPSEFGAKRMKEEELKGPTELVTCKPNDSITDEEEYHKEQLRIYQLNRLKYYYGVIECDSKETANHIYEECDGIEYEGSSNRIDLRFIPDDMTFDEKPREKVHDLPDQNSYKPSPFICSALQQTKVNLTWDETDPNRVAVTMRKFTKDDLEELDVQDYLASDSGDEGEMYPDTEKPVFDQVSGEEDEEAQINKYRALLQGITDSNKIDKAKDMDMEIIWEPGLKETTQDLVKKAKEKSELTPWEKYLEKSKKKKMEKKLTKSGRNTKEQADAGDDISDDDIPSCVNLNDSYFKEELDKFKAKEGSASKKKKRLTQEELEQQQREEAELELLMSDEEDTKKHFNLKELIQDEKQLKGKKKRKMRKLKEKIAQNKAAKEQEDDFQIDVEDPRFKELYENPLFNIDPTAPEFKKTKATKKVIEAKLKRRMSNLKQSPDERDLSSRKKQKNLNEDGAESSEKKSDPHLATLIKSVKAKTKFIQEKKKKVQKS